MVAYADTSFLFSLYAQDTNTVLAASIAKTLNTGLVITPLQLFELRNALRLSVFRTDITSEECKMVLALIESDMRTGVLIETTVSWAHVYSEAEKLSTNHTHQVGTRAFDILHVAMAITLGARDFYTFDIRQKDLADKADLRAQP